MKKKMQRIIAMMLAVTLFTTLCANTALADNESGDMLMLESSEVTLSQNSVADLAAVLSSDPDARNVQLDGNILTFILPDDTIVRIVETVGPNGKATFAITEGNQTDILTFDYSQNEMAVNGGALTFTKTETAIYSGQGHIAENNAIAAAPLAVTWVKIGNTAVYHAAAEAQIRSLTSTTILAIILALLQPGGITLAIAGIILSYFIRVESLGKDFYIARDLYYDAVLQFNHYLEIVNYYEKSNCTGLIHSTQYEQLI